METSAHTDSHRIRFFCSLCPDWISLSEKSVKTQFNADRKLLSGYFTSHPLSRSFRRNCSAAFKTQQEEIPKISAVTGRNRHITDCRNEHMGHGQCPDHTYDQLYYPCSQRSSGNEISSNRSDCRSAHGLQHRQFPYTPDGGQHQHRTSGSRRHCRRYF